LIKRSLTYVKSSLEFLSLGKHRTKLYYKGTPYYSWWPFGLITIALIIGYIYVVYSIIYDTYSLKERTITHTVIPLKHSNFHNYTLKDLFDHGFEFPKIKFRFDNWNTFFKFNGCN
jgi:hypothetical protein